MRDMTYTRVDGKRIVQVRPGHIITATDSNICRVAEGYMEPFTVTDAPILLDADVRKFAVWGGDREYVFEVTDHFDTAEPVARTDFTWVHDGCAGCWEFVKAIEAGAHPAQVFAPRHGPQFCSSYPQGTTHCTCPSCWG